MAPAICNGCGEEVDTSKQHTVVDNEFFHTACVPSGVDSPEEESGTTTPEASVAEESTPISSGDEDKDPTQVASSGDEDKDPTAPVQETSDPTAAPEQVT